MRRVHRINMQSIIMINILLLLCMLCGDADNGRIINSLIISLVGLTVVKFMRQRRIKRSFFTSAIIRWNFWFFILCFASVLWSIYEKDSFAMSFVMFKRLIIIFSIVTNIVNKEDLLKVLKYYLVACMYMMFRITYFYVLKIEVGSKMWDFACGNYFNTVSQMLALAIIIAYYILTTEEKNKLKKLSYILFVIFSVWHIYITGSRKGLIMPIVELFIYLVIANRRSISKMIKAFVIMFIIGGVGIYILCENQELTDRMIIMFQMLFKGETLDESTQLRKYFITLAGQMFTDKPVLGQGINTFVGELDRSIGKAMYSHNNYFEIASSLGVVGLLTYYWYYIYLIKGLLKKINLDNIAVLGLSIILTLVIFEYGIVTYSVLIYPIILAILGLIVEIDESENNREKSN